MSSKWNLDDYVPVQERINSFVGEYPDGAIRTQLMSLPDEFDRVVFKAEVFKHRDHVAPDATGWAAEIAGTGGANQTSWHENAETSAIGRALANMGYATSLQNRASREEMEKVARGPQLPPRGRTTSENTVPETGEIVGWTEFWKYVEAEGLPRDKKALETAMGTTLGANPAYALERFQAWRKDVAEAEQGVLV